MFEKAKKLVHQRGAVHDQQQALKPDTPAPVEAVSNKPTQKHKKFNHQNHNQRPKAPTEASKKCSCGKGAHSRDVCPAKDASCHKCRKKGHFSAMCFTKGVNNVSEDNSPLDSFISTQLKDHKTASPGLCKS